MVKVFDVLSLLKLRMVVISVLYVRMLLLVHGRSVGTTISVASLKSCSGWGSGMIGSFNTLECEFAVSGVTESWTRLF